MVDVCKHNIIKECNKNNRHKKFSRYKHLRGVHCVCIYVRAQSTYIVQNKHIMPRSSTTSSRSSRSSASSGVRAYVRSAPTVTDRAIRRAQAHPYYRPDSADSETRPVQRRTRNLRNSVAPTIDMGPVYRPAGVRPSSTVTVTNHDGSYTTVFDLVDTFRDDERQLIAEYVNPRTNQSLYITYTNEPDVHTSQV